MSEPAHAPAPAGKGSAPKHENVFTHKLGPLPMWVWVSIAAAILVAWRLYSSKKAAAANGTSTGAQTSGSSTGGTAGLSNSEDVPQFVNQSYTDVTAPSSTTYVHPAMHQGHGHYQHPPGQDHDHGHAPPHQHGAPPKQGHWPQHGGQGQRQGGGGGQGGDQHDQSGQGNGGRNAQYGQWSGQWSHQQGGWNGGGQNNRSGRGGGGGQHHGWS